MIYRQLTREQRYQLAALLATGNRQCDAARALGVHRSTISRELSRNRSSVGYAPATAQRCREHRCKAKGVARRKIRGELKDVVESMLRLGWSPEQISGRLLCERNVRLSHETIYQHVIRDARQCGGLRYSMRHRGYGYRRLRKTRYIRLPRSPRHRSITSRPSSVDRRSDIGHWERDLVLSRQGGPAILVLVERATRYVELRWLDRVTCTRVAELTVDALRERPLITVTNDNGAEFSNPLALEARLGVPIYFTDPGKPWQRGTVENTAGLTRQYFHKRARHPFTSAHSWIAPAMQHTLNVRPRKSLGYRTPYEALFQQQLSLLSRQALHFGLECTFGT